MQRRAIADVALEVGARVQTEGVAVENQPSWHRLESSVGVHWTLYILLWT